MRGEKRRRTLHSFRDGKCIAKVIFVMFTTPWKGLVTDRHALGEWQEAVCAETLREFGENRKPPVAETPASLVGSSHSDG